MKRKLEEYMRYMEEEEKSTATRTQYRREISAFLEFAEGKPLTKELTVRYKEYLAGRYKAVSVNTKIAAVNGFLSFIGKEKLRMRRLKVQRIAFMPEERELTREEYGRLLKAAGERDEKLKLLLQTICATGIRVSELKYITAEAVELGRAVIRLKGKVRVVLICGRLRKLLRKFVRSRRIKSGPIFITRRGNPLDRSNIWRKMKSLCDAAGVSRSKVFPHNLRHLFAKCFYSVSKDISRLADVLGHSSINTTRIYVMSSDTEHMKILERLHLAEGQ